MHHFVLAKLATSSIRVNDCLVLSIVVYLYSLFISDDGTKLVRRTSYLMATNKERVQLHMERNREDISEEQDGVDAQ